MNFSVPDYEYTADRTLPDIFALLSELGCLRSGDIKCTSDGFFAARVSVADILIGKGITTFPDSEDNERECGKYFDDWYIYAVPCGAGHVYSLFKLREQEYDALLGHHADGDTPGVTVSFIEFDASSLLSCLADPSHAKRKAFNAELNRVVAAPGQVHHKALKDYFIASEAEAPYLIAELYVRHIASFSENGSISVPEAYAKLYENFRAGNAPTKRARLPKFINENNEAAGHIVCDHAKIHITDPTRLTMHEKYAILATHTANVSFNSFAAEIQYHARFLVGMAKLPLPIPGRSVYASAIRADMTIADTEFEGPAPFYRLDSRIVTKQAEHHGKY